MTDSAVLDADAIPAALKEIFSRVLEVPADLITADAGPRTIRGWDSLRHVELIIAVEEQYGLSFSPTEIFALNTVQQFCELLANRSVKR